jgi:hypothetical protein
MRPHHAKKNELKPWLRVQWVIPPKANAGFVCATGDVLAVYTRPYDPGRPQVCPDEYCECARCGTANLFMLFGPLAGKRHVGVTGRRAAVDFARVVRDLADMRYPAAKKAVRAMDNLNTHRPAPLHRAFGPEEARRLEIHYTPKHGSWLDMAEIWRRSALTGGSPMWKR